MLRTSMPMLAGILLAALVGASGCTSLNSVSSPSIFRGQDPAEMPPVDPGVAASPMSPMGQDAPVSPLEEPMAAGQSMQAPMGDQQYVDGGYGVQGGYCPPGGHYPAFVGPRGMGGGCRPGYGCGNQFDWYPRHHLSYSYSTPRNLSYPTQGAPAGQVAYPYYTLKGPGDFFKQD